jgi:Tfp pilus assembly ATPase PilU
MEKYEEYLKDPKKYVAFLNELMLEKNATDMYLTFNEPPTLRIMEEVNRQMDLPKLDDTMLNKIALALMNKTGLDYFEKH